MINVWETDKFFRRWRRSTIAFIYIEIALGLINAGVAVIDWDWYSFINIAVVILCGSIAYWLYASRLPYIDREHAAMRDIDTQIDELTKALREPTKRKERII